jgi:hypothetical protein
MPSTETPLARPRATVVHPGPPAAVRVEHAQASASRSLRLVLAPGQTLQEALLAALMPWRVRSAALSIWGGLFDELAFCLPIRDPRGEVVCTYGDPIPVRGVRLVAGSVSFALGDDDRPFIHCHASFCGPDAILQGGHVLPERARIGAEPVVARVTVLEGVALRMQFDPETRLNIMRPQPEAHGG